MSIFQIKKGETTSTEIPYLELQNGNIKFLFQGEIDVLPENSELRKKIKKAKAVFETDNYETLSSIEEECSKATPEGDRIINPIDMQKSIFKKLLISIEDADGNKTQIREDDDEKTMKNINGLDPEFVKRLYHFYDNEYTYQYQAEIISSLTKKDDNGE